MRKQLTVNNHRLSIARSGFTMIELMAVVAIIMILASIIMVNVAKNVERGKDGRAYADIDTLVKAINLYQIDNGKLPDKLDELFEKGVKYGPYISTDKEKSLTTPWDTQYQYTPNEAGGSYKVWAEDSKGNVRAEKTINF